MLNLRRITTDGSFIPQVDGLRFVAIISVVLFHLLGSLGHNGAVLSPFSGDDPMLSDLSKRGVELFFCISGFVLSTPFIAMKRYGKKPVSLRSYFLRRLTRLEPPYILSLIICSVALAVSQRTLYSLLPHLAAGVLYAHTLIFKTSNPINGVTWSLEVEVQFYLLVPLLAGIFSISNGAARRAFLAASILITATLSLPLQDTMLRVSILYYLTFFLTGFLAADLYLEHGSAWSQFPDSLYDVVALVGWPLLWIPAPVAIEHVLLPFLLLALIVAAFRGRVCSRLFAMRWIVDIGGMCYTIYLLHFLLISSFGRIFKPLHIGNSFLVYYCMQAVIVLPLVLIVCIAYFLLIERPCMDRNWPSKLLVKFRTQKEQTLLKHFKQRVHHRTFGDVFPETVERLDFKVAAVDESGFSDDVRSK